jgi:hypothetical protein
MSAVALPPLLQALIGGDLHDERLHLRGLRLM